MLKLKAIIFPLKTISIFAGMPAEIYYPFRTYNFSELYCFLSGRPVAAGEKVPVFPRWLMDRYGLEGKPFGMLDDRVSTYGGLSLPCSPDIRDSALEPMETIVAAAFAEGFDAVHALSEEVLFKWTGKLLYGILFNEIRAALQQQRTGGEEFNISQSLLHKFSNLHLMLQSICLPLVFEDFSPYSIFLCRVDNAENEFIYRDEINTLTCSLRLKDFGLTICLQDNGANRAYHKNLLGKISGKTLHPIQFEELNARVFYSAYLFNRLPEYEVLPHGGEIFLEAMPLRGISNKPLFDTWNNMTYSQVLESFWKKWNILRFEIIKDPEQPMSLLLDAAGNFNAAAIEFSR